MIFFSILYLTSFFSLFSIQHPTGFSTLKECVENGATVKYLLEENELKQFVLTLENGVVVGEGGIVTNDGKILTDTEIYKSDQQQLLQANRDISKENFITFDGTLAIISSPGQQCYYHWLLQIIPRLKILKDSKLSYDKIYIYADNFKYNWQQDSLYHVMNYLDIPRDKLLLSSTIIKAKRLLVPSVPWVPSKPEFWDTQWNWYKQFFKDTFTNQAERTPNRIFISRSKALYRRISNESELMKLLNTKKFVSYNLEDISVSEQANLFKNADVIVGPHGAGWTNLIFCKPKTKIIEIDHGLKGNEQRSAFKGMTNRMECSYHPFYTDLLEPTNCPENIKDPINQDMMVDITAFKGFLDQLGI